VRECIRLKVSFRMYEGLFSLLFLMHRSCLICLQLVYVDAPVCVNAYVKKSLFVCLEVTFHTYA